MVNINHRLTILYQSKTIVSSMISPVLPTSFPREPKPDLEGSLRKFASEPPGRIEKKAIDFTIETPEIWGNLTCFV